jgi:hypothetical protein
MESVSDEKPQVFNAFRSSSALVVSHSRLIRLRINSVSLNRVCIW